LRHLAEQLIALDRVLLLCPVHVLACRTRTTLADVLGACEANLGSGEWRAASPLKAAKRLQQLVESNRSPVLLLDDADLLGDDVLEALVTLTGLRAAERRLLSIVLTGPPSILGRVSTITGDDEMLGAIRTVKLDPMAAPDVARLIRHRLRAAGRAEDAIGPDAIAQIARHSAGVPGAVVQVCRRVMQLAENWSPKSVTADIVTEAIGEATFDVKRGSSHPEFIACASMSAIATEPSPRPAASQDSITTSVPSLDGESRPEPLPKPRDTTPAPEPLLVRESHWSLPRVTLGRPRQGTTRSYQPVQHLLGRSRRLKLMLVSAGIFSVVLVAGLAMLSGDFHELADRTHTLAVGSADLHRRDHGTPSVANTDASRPYDSSTALPAASAIALPNRGAAAVTTPTPLPSPTIDATEGATGAPSAEATAPLEETIAAYRAALAAIEEKLGRPTSPTVESAFASVSPPAPVSESANDKVTRVQLAARMQGLEPGPPIDVPVRLSKGQARTIYFFTELHGLSGRTVLHRWEWNGRIMQERQLHPSSQSWRAYTGMVIAGDMRGSWRVSTVDATTGKVLVRQRFEVE